MTELLISLFIRDKDQVNDVSVRKKYGFLASGVGIACNLLLFILKFILGVFSGSIAVSADAFNNLSDAGSSIVTLLGFKLASRPADREHPYGHGRYEYLSGFIIAILILIIGFEFFHGSITKILNPVKIEVNAIVIAGLFMSILIKLWMSVFYRKLGKKIGSKTISAASTDSLSDVLTTSVTLIGVACSLVWDFPIDGYLGLFVAITVMVAGFKVASDTLSPLLGRAPSPELVANLRRMVLSFDGILDVHDIIVHDYGPGRTLASLHADVPANKNLVEVHDLIDKIEKEIAAELRVDAVIHVDPRDTECRLTAELMEHVEKIIAEYSESFGIHDFRIVDECITFDLSVPHEDKRKNEEIIADLEAKIDRKTKIIIDRT